VQPKQDQKNINPSYTTSKFILIGEDDADDEDLLKEIFTSVDDSLSLIFVNNGRKLLTTLEQMKSDNLPCLILLDYNMPEMNGAEILSRLNHDEFLANIPKVIWSTSNSDTYKKLCIDSGAHDYIIKPSNIKELTDAIRYMLSFCRFDQNT
jgi:CheY-like chemotaxis protein